MNGSAKDFSGTVAALFDLDGVIVDTEGHYTEFWPRLTWILLIATLTPEIHLNNAIQQRLHKKGH